MEVTPTGDVIVRTDRTKVVFIWLGKGIVDRISYFRNDRIYWSEMRGAKLIKMRSQKLIVIDVHNPRQFTDRGNLLQRWIKAINQRMVGSPVTLAKTGLDSGAEQVLAAIERYFDRAVGSRVSPPG